MKTTETKPHPTLEPLAVDNDGVRQLLGANLSNVTIWRMEKQGKLRRVPGVRTRLFTVSSIRRLVECETADLTPRRQPRAEAIETR